MATLSYFPTEAETKRFWDLDRATAKAQVEVPTGLPKRLDSSLAWSGNEIEGKDAQWTIVLTAEEVVLIEAALRKFEASHEDLSAISPSTFCLPDGLCQRLKSASDQVYGGFGFQVIRGLNPARYSPKQNVIIYAGVAANAGFQRGFVDRACEEVLAHIVNVQEADNNRGPVAPGFSNVPLSFHTDFCEIMAFYHLETALKGGHTILSSSWRTYNELAFTHPEVLHTLAEPWVLDTFKPYALHPPRYLRLLEKSSRDKVLFRFSRYPILGWMRERNPDLPVPTEAQLKAIDNVHFITQRNALTIPAAKGDIVFVNDMALMHARTGFDDSDRPEKRHIVKMFFRDPAKNWPIPPSVESERMTMFGPNRPGGKRNEVWLIQRGKGDEDGPLMNG